MSEQCHVCGPVKHEAPTVLCAPCALLGSFASSLDLDQADDETDLQFRARIERALNARPGHHHSRWTAPL